MGEDCFAVWQGHPVEDRAGLFENPAVGVDGGVGHGAEGRSQQAPPLGKHAARRPMFVLSSPGWLS
jgi:hypothetical protein